MKYLQTDKSVLVTQLMKSYASYFREKSILWMA